MFFHPFIISFTDRFFIFDHSLWSWCCHGEIKDCSFRWGRINAPPIHHLAFAYSIFLFVSTSKIHSRTRLHICVLLIQSSPDSFEGASFTTPRSCNLSPSHMFIQALTHPLHSVTHAFTILFMHWLHWLTHQVAYSLIHWRIYGFSQTVSFILTWFFVSHSPLQLFEKGVWTFWSCGILTPPHFWHITRMSRRLSLAKLTWNVTCQWHHWSLTTSTFHITQQPHHTSVTSPIDICQYSSQTLVIMQIPRRTRIIHITHASHHTSPTFHVTRHSHHPHFTSRVISNAQISTRNAQVCRHTYIKSPLTWLWFCACILAGSPFRVQGVEPTLLQNHLEIKAQKSLNWHCP